MAQKETKKKKAMTPAQLANLRPIKPGEVRNPEGGRAHNPILRAMRNLTIKEFREVIELALTSNTDAVQDMLKDKESSAIQAGIAACILKAIGRGDWGTLEQIVSRLVGKLPDKLEVVSQNTTILCLEDKELVGQLLKEFHASL